MMNFNNKIGQGNNPFLNTGMGYNAGLNPRAGTGMQSIFGGGCGVGMNSGLGSGFGVGMNPGLGGGYGVGMNQGYGGGYGVGMGRNGSIFGQNGMNPMMRPMGSRGNRSLKRAAFITELVFNCLNLGMKWTGQILNWCGIGGTQNPPPKQDDPDLKMLQSTFKDEGSAHYAISKNTDGTYTVTLTDSSDSSKNRVYTGTKDEILEAAGYKKSEAEAPVEDDDKAELKTDVNPTEEADEATETEEADEATETEEADEATETEETDEATETEEADEATETEEADEAAAAEKEETPEMTETKKFAAQALGCAQDGIDIEEQEDGTYVLAFDGASYEGSLDDIKHQIKIDTAKEIADGDPDKKAIQDFYVGLGNDHDADAIVVKKTADGSTYIVETDGTRFEGASLDEVKGKMEAVFGPATPVENAEITGKTTSAEETDAAPALISGNVSGTGIVGTASYTITEKDGNYELDTSKIFISKLTNADYQTFVRGLTDDFDYISDDLKGRDGQYHFRGIPAGNKEALRLHVQAEGELLAKQTAVYRDLKAKQDGGQTLSQVEQRFMNEYLNKIQGRGLKMNADGQLVDA